MAVNIHYGHDGDIINPLYAICMVWEVTGHVLQLMKLYIDIWDSIFFEYAIVII